jgi:chemotaxis response regulator CheB
VIKLLVIDDDLLMTQALASGLANQEFESIQTANNASEAMKKFRTFKPDVDLEGQSPPPSRPFGSLCWLI